MTAGRTRHGAALLIELGVAMILIAALSTLLIGIGAMARDLAAADRREAELELARNLCRQLRAGLDPALPPAWSIERSGLDGAWQQVTVVAPSGRRLMTVRRQP